MRSAFVKGNGNVVPLRHRAGSREEAFVNTCQTIHLYWLHLAVCDNLHVAHLKHEHTFCKSTGRESILTKVREIFKASEMVKRGWHLI